LSYQLKPAARTNGTSASTSASWPSCATAGAHRAAQPAVTSTTPAATGTARKSGHVPHPAVPPRRRQAEQIINHEYGSLTPEDEGMATSATSRPQARNGRW